MNKWQTAATLALTVCATLVGGTTALAIMLEDPATYQVKNTWSASSLGIPANIGGLLFTGDGNTLYVVGASESSASALYAVPVTRNPVSNEVVDLGPAAAVSKVFDGNPATPGLDAGFEFGPSGTLFYTYWSANYLGERPGGIGGSETQFDMSDVGVPSSAAGLTFSPHFADPGTGFGQMQVSAWQGANIYDVPLTPASAGIFTPGTVALFVTLPQQGTGAIQYIPSGPQAGNMMYVNWNFGEVRTLSIDPATGLPIDKGTNLPTRGTANPIDDRFAYDLGVGPWGLEFDPRTNDFFVGTWGGNPPNTIIQVGGFPKTEKCENGVDDDEDDLVDCADPDCTSDPSCAPQLDHFVFYKTKSRSDSPKFASFAPVTLADQFGATDYQVAKPKYLGLPANKNDEGIIDAVTHVKDYPVKPVAGSPKFAKRKDVEIANQCNTLRLEVTKPASILVPTLKSLAVLPPAPDIANHQLDHYLCYKAKPQAKLADGTKLPKFPKGIQVVVADQFQTRRYDLKKITRLCNPVDKSGNPVLASGPNKGQPFPITPTPIRHPNYHLVCYQAKRATKLIPQTDCGPTTPGDPGTKIEPAQPKHEAVASVFVNNQFGPELLDTVKEAEFCIPSTKAILPP